MSRVAAQPIEIPHLLPSRSSAAEPTRTEGMARQLFEKIFDNVFAKDSNVLVFYTDVTAAAEARSYPRERSTRSIFPFINQVECLAKYKQNWDSYDAEAPNGIAVESARGALLMLNALGVLPDRVAPSAEGGIGLCFYKGQRYADIEFRNSGEILAIKADATSQPAAWEVKPSQIRTALEQIREFIVS